jgi:hypothetical protein
MSADAQAIATKLGVSGVVCCRAQDVYGWTNRGIER